MRTIVVAAMLGTALVAAPASTSTQDGRPSDSLERPFVANGRIKMDLSAGEYRISGSPDAKIRLQWSVRDSDQLSKVKARVDVRDQDATITTDGPSNHFKVAILVPARADLHVRLTAGELTGREHPGQQGCRAARRRDRHRRGPRRRLSPRRRGGVGRGDQSDALQCGERRPVPLVRLERQGAVPPSRPSEGGRAALVLQGRHDGSVGACGPYRT